MWKATDFQSISFWDSPKNTFFLPNYRFLTQAPVLAS